MATTISAGGWKKAEINMTPLIDVLLVLIIIFMVITPLTPRGLPTLVAQPPREPYDGKESHEIVVTVRSDGTLLLNREALNSTSLRVRLEHFYRSGATRVIFVRGEKAIEFGRVAEVIDMARGAGVFHVALMTNWATSPGMPAVSRCTRALRSLRTIQRSPFGVRPDPPSTLQNPLHLRRLKRLGQHIMPAQVQHLHPKILVRESGGDDEKRMVWQQLQCRKKVFPVSGRQIPFGDDDRNRPGSQNAEGGFQRVG